MGEGREGGKADMEAGRQGGTEMLQLVAAKLWTSICKVPQKGRGVVSESSL